MRYQLGLAYQDQRIYREATWSGRILSRNCDNHWKGEPFRSVSLMSKETKLESQPLKLEWQSECKHCTCQLITGASVRQQSCLRDGRQLPCSQGKYLALLLYSQDSLYCKPTHRRSCQELPLPLRPKSFNRGL